MTQNTTVTVAMSVVLIFISEYHAILIEFDEKKKLTNSSFKCSIFGTKVGWNRVRIQNSLHPELVFISQVQKGNQVISDALRLVLAASFSLFLRVLLATYCDYLPGLVGGGG